MRRLFPALIAALFVVSVVGAPRLARAGEGDDPPAGGDGQDAPIPVKQFVADTNKQFDAMAQRHPNFEPLISKNKTIFNENVDKYLKKKDYQDWEKDYVRDTVNNALGGMGRKLTMMDRANAEGWSADKTQNELHAVTAEIEDKQNRIQSAAQAQFEKHASMRHGGFGGDPTADPNDAQSHKKQWGDSDVVKLQDFALKEALRTNSNPGGNPNGGAGGNTTTPTDGTGAGSNGPTGGNAGGPGGSAPGGGGGTLADTIGQLTDAGAAKTLATAAGNALDHAQYSQAEQDAKSALMLDPKNQNAIAVTHFADGRTDGVATGAPAGAAAKGAAAGAGGAAGGSGSDAGGGVNGVGGGAAGGFFGSAGAGASASLAAGGGAAGGLSRFSPEQAQSAAASAMGMGDYGGALSAVNRALASDPNNPALLALRASIEGKQKDYAKAEADAKAALAEDPKNTGALRTLGFAQVRNKDYKDALASANELIELNPNDPYGYALRGHAYGSMGDRDAMMADLQRAAELDPRFAAAAAKMAGQLQPPDDKDILFLFPGEDAAAPAKAPAPAGRGRSFGLLVGASALGGLLLALGLLHTVLAPLKEQITSAFTRITRTGPTVGETQEFDTAAPASVNGLMPGLIRGQYEISRQIGVGGMGMVFAGTDRSLGRPVAIKKMRDEMRFDPREKARFVAEAKTVAALHHPGIVDIYAIAEEGDDVYLVFEYVEGQTIHDLLQSGGKLAPETAARYTRASAEALEYAHSRGVIHRDMKPSNVMIDRSGAVKVMDFGIARMAKDTMMRQSMTNTIAGTPPYMAPEQEQGRVRSESDVYSLAICSYEMLTGKLPFVGTGGGMLLNKINMSFVAPSRQTAGLPPALDPVFERAFQADPDKRYRTPGEFAGALESALTDPVRV